MRDSDIERYRTILQKKERELSAGLHNRRDIAVVSSPDELEQVQLAEVRELEIDKLNRGTNLLRMVKDALRRISDGSYGLCQSCDTEIKPARLNAVPWAALCIRCQVDSENDGVVNPAHFSESLEDAA